MRRLFVACLVMVGVFLAEASHATYVVDTGPPSDGHADNFWIGPDSVIAGQFTLAAGTHIGAMEAYIQVPEEGPQAVDLVGVLIYSDVGGLPAGDPLIFKSFTFEGYYDESGEWGGPEKNTGWHGTSGYSGYLNAGTYWISIQSDYDNYGIPACWIGTQDGTVPRPLPEAVTDAIYVSHPQAEWWFPNETSNLSVRIEEWSTPVPEPTTMLLVGSGLIGLAGYGRKKFFKK